MKLIGGLGGRAKFFYTRWSALPFFTFHVCFVSTTLLFHRFQLSPHPLFLLSSSFLTPVFLFHSFSSLHTFFTPIGFFPTPHTCFTLLPHHSLLLSHLKDCFRRLPVNFSLHFVLILNPTSFLTPILFSDHILYPTTNALPHYTTILFFASASFPPVLTLISSSLQPPTLHSLIHPSSLLPSNSLAGD